MKYKIIKDKDGEINGCDSCQCEVPLAEFSNCNPRKKEKQMLCELCSSTLLSNEINARYDFISPLAFAQAINFLYSKIGFDKKLTPQIKDDYE